MIQVEHIASQKQNQSIFVQGLSLASERAGWAFFLDTSHGSQKRMSHLWQGGGKLNKLRKLFGMIDEVGLYFRKSQPRVVNINIPLKEAALLLRCRYINFGLFLLGRNLKRNKHNMFPGEWWCFLCKAKGPLAKKSGCIMYPGIPGCNQQLFPISHPCLVYFPIPYIYHKNQPNVYRGKSTIHWMVWDLYSILVVSPNDFSNSLFFFRNRHESFQVWSTQRDIFSW